MSRAAILCAGLDSVRRGYESHQRLLFDHLSEDPEFRGSAMLFKRDGPGVAGREVALHSPSRRSTLVRSLSGWRGDDLYWESVFFALAFASYCRARGLAFDRLLIIEPTVCGVLRKLRWMLPGSPVLVLTHGISDEPRHYLPFTDEVHEVNIENFRRSTADNPRGIPIHLIPHFVRPGSAPTPEQKAELKKLFGIRTPLALLSVGVIQRAQKRMDYLIEEAGRLGDDWSLVICGSIEQPDLVERARALLGDRFVHLALPREEMPRAYQASDLFALTSLNEGFGIVLIEAMSYGLPVVAHRKDHFEWVIRDGEACIDMTIPGALCGFVSHPAGDPEWRRLKGEKNLRTIAELYTWESVKTAYFRLAGDYIGQSREVSA